MYGLKPDDDRNSKKIKLTRSKPVKKNTRTKNVKEFIRLFSNSTYATA